MMRSFIALTLALVTVPAIGHADIIGAYVAGKADYVHGTGTAFEGLDADMGYGVEAGVELLGIELWGEALFMGEEQYLITANLGIGLEIGGDISITAGAYTGPCSSSSHQARALAWRSPLTFAACWTQMQSPSPPLRSKRNTTQSSPNRNKRPTRWPLAGIWSGVESSSNTRFSRS